MADGLVHSWVSIPYSPVAHLVAGVTAFGEVELLMVWCDGVVRHVHSVRLVKEGMPRCRWCADHRTAPGVESQW